jgi:hypothetical protein
MAQPAGTTHHPSTTPPRRPHPRSGVGRPRPGRHRPAPSPAPQIPSPHIGKPVSQPPEPEPSARPKHRCAVVSGLDCDNDHEASSIEQRARGHPIQGRITAHPSASARPRSTSRCHLSTEPETQGARRLRTGRRHGVRYPHNVMISFPCRRMVRERDQRSLIGDERCIQECIGLGLGRLCPERDPGLTQKSPAGHRSGPPDKKNACRLACRSAPGLLWLGHGADARTR